MRRSKAEAEQTRRDILAAALVLFDEQGYAQTSLSAIAARAGVTRGAVYGHFANKSDLLAALASIQFDELFAQNAAAIAAPDTLKAIGDNFTTFFHGLIARPQHLRLFRIIHQQKHGGNEDMIQLRCENEARWQTQCREMVERGKAGGELPADADAEYLYFRITITIAGLLEYCMSHPQPNPQYIARAIRSTLAGLGRE